MNFITRLYLESAWEIDLNNYKHSWLWLIKSWICQWNLNNFATRIVYKSYFISWRKDDKLYWFAVSGETYIQRLLYRNKDNYKTIYLPAGNDFRNTVVVFPCLVFVFVLLVCWCVCSVLFSKRFTVTNRMIVFSCNRKVK